MIGLFDCESTMTTKRPAPAADAAPSSPATQERVPEAYQPPRIEQKVALDRVTLDSAPITGPGGGIGGE